MTIRQYPRPKAKARWRAWAAAAVLAAAGALGLWPGLRAQLAPARVWVGQQLSRPANIRKELEKLEDEKAVLLTRLAMLEEGQAGLEQQAGEEALKTLLPGCSFTPVYLAGQDPALGSRYWVAHPEGQPIPGNCPLVDENGFLAGVTRQPAGGCALVVPPSDPEFSAACWVGASRLGGIFTGGQVEGLPRQGTFEPGEVVVTSGLGGVFPQGLVVGWLESTAPHQGSQTGQVALAAGESPRLLYLVQKEAP